MARGLQLTYLEEYLGPARRGAAPLKGSQMTARAILAATVIAATAHAAVTSQVTFTLIPDDTEIARWNFTIGLADNATDAFDSGRDALEPPWAPAPEVRLHTLDVPGAIGAMMLDYRDGANPIDVSPYWTTIADPLRAEVWGLGALDANYDDLCAIDGAELPTTGYTTGIMTWDLSEAAGFAHYLYCIDLDEAIALTPGGTYDWSVMNRYGAGPTFVISCTAPIPEPGTAVLLALGLGAAAWLARGRML